MIEIVGADITLLEVDAIVNAANEALRGGAGADGAVHRAAGPELLAECKLHPGCPTSQAVLTKRYRLPARFVIHVVGPVWQGGGGRERELLESAYEGAFHLAREEGSIRSIAFPAISTGVYRFPKADAARIALTVMRRHQGAFDRSVACLFDRENVERYRALLGSDV